MPHPIKFGTDGWRAVIADGYTFANLARVARATSRWLHARSPAPAAVLGHDTRFMGRAFAEHAARVLAADGVRVILADTFVPTPAVSYAAKALGAEAGVVITASHNPPQYQGYKLKASFGGPATPAMIAEVEALIDDAPVETDGMPAFAALVAEGAITRRDLRRAYLDLLRDGLDLDAVRGAGRIAHDAMYGAGQGYVADLVGEDRVVPVRSVVNPGFEGQAPEPIARNLEPLSRAVVKAGCAAGLANDGDADRIGMMDEEGRYVTAHQILALLVDYLYTERGLRGGIVKTFSTTHLLDRMGDAYGLPVETLPIGFKHIAPRIIEGDVLVGGEESGGIAVKGHLPERDGLFIGLLVVEMMGRRGRPLSALVKDLYDRFGPHHYHREDVHLTLAQKEHALGRLDREGGLDRIDGHPVTRVETLDGYKHVTGGGWLLIRPSGTEPVLRVYAEAETEAAARALVTDALRQLGAG
ncbi:MAG: phosphoglucomutase/phosphomannomutase family protein [Rhodothermales bacterium]|nr:phosphoglucomutase/phosphomannomutase family protein [Rhodothermales bacterium]